MYRFLLLFSLVLQSGWAMYNGNPSDTLMPETGIFFQNGLVSFEAGYEYDATFARAWKMQQSMEGGKVKTFTASDHLGVLTVNVADRAEIYSGLGTMQLQLKQKFEGEVFHYDSNTAFAWTLGGRALIAYWDRLDLGLAASALHFSPSLEDHGGKVHYTEWQVGAGLSYQLRWLYPYLGLKYANARAKFYDLKRPTYLPKGRFIIKTKKIPGLFLGCGFAPDRGLSLNVEARFIDETSLTAAANLKF